MKNLFYPLIFLSLFTLSACTTPKVVVQQEKVSVTPALFEKPKIPHLKPVNEFMKLSKESQVNYLINYNQSILVIINDLINRLDAIKSQTQTLEEE